MSAFDVDNYLTMLSRTTMFAVDRATMICRPMVYVPTQTQTPTWTSRFLLQGHRFVHLTVTTVPSEPSYLLGLSHLV